MSTPLRRGFMLGLCTFSLVLAPIVFNRSAFWDITSIAKEKGGDGGSHGGGNSGDHGNGNAGGNAAGGSSGNASAGNGGHEKAGDATAVANLDGTGKGKAGKAKNLNAQLGGLNSLNRNINGLMKSADPRMALVRAYVQAGADLQSAQAALDGAEATMTQLQAALSTYMSSATVGLVAYDGSTIYSDPTLQGLTDRLAELDAAILLDPTNQAAIDEQLALAAVLDTINSSPELAAVTTQQETIAGLETEIAALVEATSDAALKTALLAAANKNRVGAAGDAYVTPELMAWAETRLDALTAAYIAQQ